MPTFWKRERPARTMRQRFLRWTVWALFLFTSSLMLIGATIGDGSAKRAHAQEGTTEAPPTLEKVADAPPPARPAAMNKVTFTVDPKLSQTTVSSPGQVTNDDTPKLSGRGAPGHLVALTVDGKKVGQVEVDADGGWTWTPEKALAAGAHVVEVQGMGLKPKPALKKEKKKKKVGQGDASGVLDRGLSFFGIFFIIGVAVLMSNNRKAINWKLVFFGVLLQLVFALLIFYTWIGQQTFQIATDVVDKLLSFTNDGSSFLFSSFVTNKWEPQLINLTFAVLPTIIFFSSLMTVAYYLGLMQKIVSVFAVVMEKLLGTSGAESLSAAANIFVGQTEAPLVIKPYVEDMTNSELMTVMTGGFATVAGGVLAIYVGILKPTFPNIASHLLAASVMSAPAALVIGKIMYPETEVPVTSNNGSDGPPVEGGLFAKLKALFAGPTGGQEFEKEDVNVIDAASRGAAEGLKLALNVAAMLLAFLALVSLINYVISLPSLLYNKYVMADLLHSVQGIPQACMGDPNALTQEVAKTCSDAWAQAPKICQGKVADGSVVACVQAVQEGTFTMPMITLQQILGYVFWPFAFAMGVPYQDCALIGQLLGEKLILNELVAYLSLSKMLADPTIVLSDRSVIIATYALCGFANVGSIGIQLGGIGGIAPSRKGDLARIAVRAMIAGTLAAFMTATIAGILV